jgi:hypothetical protein
LTVFCSVAREFLFCCAAKILEANTSNSNWLYFVLPRSEKLWDLPTKATQIGCTLVCHAAKILEFDDKTAFCSAVQRKFWNLSNKNHSN